jgi:hypothetical protein
VESGSPPPASVLKAFKIPAREQLVPLAGGIAQSAWRAGDVVLKPVQEFNPGEGDWVAEVLDAVVEDGFRVVKPIRADDGRWLADGWTAWHWIEGEHRRKGWAEVIAASQRMHHALSEAIVTANVAPRPAWLDTRGHRWAISEATVWHGAPLPPVMNEGELEWSLFDRALRLGPPLSDAERAQCQVVHGDVSGNVLETEAGLAFIDMSPGWRPAVSVDAQIAVEAVAWFKADPSELAGFATADLARACAFRLACGLQFSADWAADFPWEVESWTRVLDLIGA